MDFLGLNLWLQTLLFIEWNKVNLDVPFTPSAVTCTVETFD